jgi:tetratricopeptide (TPR) repeat protein
MRIRLFPLLIAGAITLAAQTDRFDLKVRNYFFAGFTGNATALAKGMKMCEDALAENPKNAEAMVWHGSGLYVQSGKAFQAGDQQKGIELYQRGLKELDEAVALAPESIGVRIPRGAVLFTGSRFVPPEMAKPLIEKAISDYEKAYEIQGPHLDQMPPHPRGELLIGLADGYSRLGDQEKARAFFEQIQSSLKGTAYEKSANLWMETKSLPAAQAGCLGCHTGN